MTPLEAAIANARLLGIAPPTPEQAARINADNTLDALEEFYSQRGGWYDTLRGGPAPTPSPAQALGMIPPTIPVIGPLAGAARGLGQAIEGVRNMQSPTPVGDMGGEGIWGPIPTFMRRYGLEDAWLSPFQRWQAGYANPLHDVFQLHQLMQIGEGQPEAVWEDYLQPFQGGTAPAYGQAGGTLGRLAAMTPEARAKVGIGWDEQEGLGNLANLLQLALRPHLGLHGAGFFTPDRLGTMRARMHAGQAGGATPGSFLDYLRQKFNLQRFGF